MSATPEQQPVARGSLAETPFGHLAIYLYRRTSSGTLLLAGRAGNEALVRFQQGKAVAARLPWGAPRLLDALLPLCGLTDGEFSFFEENLLAGRDGVLTGVVDPYEMLVASLRDHARDDMVEAVLERYKGGKLRLQPGRDLNRLRLSDEIRPLLELIRAAPATAEELVKLSPLRATTTKRMLYALVVTHMISPHEDRNQEAFKSHVDARSGHPPFTQVNEVAIAATPAWRQLVSLRPGAPPAAQSPAGTSNAPRANAGPKGTSTPPQSKATQSGPAPSHADDRAARMRKAEQLLQHARYDEVPALFDELPEKEREQADVLALRAHALFEKHRADLEGLPRTVVDTLKKALELDADQPRALYVRGLVYQRAGDSKKAVASFKRVLQVDPKHIEAKREIRLARLRGGD